MKSPIKNNKNLSSKIMFIFLLCILFFGINIFINFATDTYWAFIHGAHEFEIIYKSSARFIPALVCKLWYLLKIPNEMFYYIMVLGALIFLFLSIYLLQSILCNAINNIYLAICVSFISIANIYIIEYFMFLEKAMFMLAIFFSILAFNYMIRYFEYGKTVLYFISIFCLLISTFTYQVIVSLYIIFCIPYIFKYSKNLKQYIFNSFLTFFNFGFAGGTNYIILKLVLKNPRISKGDGLMNNLINTVKGLKKTTITTFDIFPHNLFFAFFILILLINIICIILCFKSLDLYLQLINLFIIFIVTAFISTITIIMGSGWFCARVIYPYASIIGIYIINLFVNVFSFKNNFHIIKKITGILLISFLIVQYICFNRIFIDKYINNYIDQYRCMIIEEEIINYEQETGNTIEYISFYKDNHSDIQYDGLFRGSELIVSSFSTDWSDLEAINYYTKNNYKRGDINPKYQEYYLEKDWTIFSGSQLIFDDDTLHLCVY